MNATATYSALHGAFSAVGADYGLGGFDVRVLVALYEAGRETASDELADMLHAHGSMCRRSLAKLRGLGHVTTCGPDGRPVRPWVRMMARLTASGEQIAREALAAITTTREDRA